jgi:hypothetical protein
MSPQFDLRGVPQPASVKTRQLEAEVNSNMGKTQILNVKIVYALSKNLGFVISFDPAAQSRVQAPQALLQRLIDVLIHFSIQGG